MRVGGFFVRIEQPGVVVVYGMACIVAVVTLAIVGESASEVAAGAAGGGAVLAKDMISVRRAEPRAEAE